MAYYFVTTFSDEQRELYGADMVTSFRGAIPEALADTVHFDWHSQDALMRDPSLQLFLGQYGQHEFAHGVTEGKVDYRKQAIKFAYKVFAYTKVPEGLTDDDWWIWLDADTRFTGEITREWLEAVCPQGYPGSYLGRQDWDHSECGWVAWAMGRHGREFLKKMRWMYTSGLVFGLPQWHDSYVFDVVRQAMELRHLAPWFNLSEGIPGNHPWPETRLGEIIEHYKGPQIKKEKFGHAA